APWQSVSLSAEGTALIIKESVQAADCLRGVVTLQLAAEMPRKPTACQPRYFLQRARLFEQMGGAGDDLQPRLGPHARLGFFVHADDYLLIAAYDEKSRRGHAGESVTRQIRTPTARNNGGDVGVSRGGDQCRRSAGG